MKKEIIKKKKKKDIPSPIGERVKNQSVVGQHVSLLALSLLLSSAFRPSPSIGRIRS